MQSLEIFRKHKDKIVQLWIEATNATYPFATPGFIKTSNDPFANPVADMTKQAALACYDAIIGEDINEENLYNEIERLVKLRSVQNFIPEKAINIFFAFRPLLQKHILPEMLAENLLMDYLLAESRIDSLTLIAFSQYVKNRETLAEIRIKEIKNKHAQLAKWAEKLNSQ